MSNSQTIIVAKLRSFPVSNSFETFLNENVAPKNIDDIVLVKDPQWPQGRRCDHLKIVVRAGETLKHVGEGASHFFRAAIVQSLADIVHEAGRCIHARTWRASKHEGEAHSTHELVELCIASQLFLTGVSISRT